MPAPDLATLMQLEEQLERAAADALRVAGLPSWRQRDRSKANTPRVEVKFFVGKATGHRGFPAPGKTALDAWNGQFLFSVVTSRADQAQSAIGQGGALGTPAAADHGPDAHAVLVGKVRALFCYGAPADAFGPTALPWLAVDKLEDAGTAPRTDGDHALDLSPLLYGVVVSVRAGAWPAALAP